ncbi:phage holin family protein [Streptomyces sp. UH6]|uniref:phage holin family protein n=1 Tax=Streptomyces sp. UH6 TaxID=2748379 RepID=UPI0015D4BD90|nr:phage holin family protein [Streptomyces sp. UH6]NYV73580.1 phage holin family protein [Streptomyces sp. UH6]
MSAPDGNPVGSERSMGQLFATASTEMSALVQDQIAYARALLKQDVKRGATGSALFTAALALLVFSLPMLSFALAYGFHAWTGWNLAWCFLLSFGVSVIVALLLAAIGTVFVKKAKKSRAPQQVSAEVKRTAEVLQNAKPHPRPAVVPVDPYAKQLDSVARSTS